MTSNYIVIHGSFGHPQEHWLAWLSTQLDNVIIPAFPTPQDQSLSSWIKAFEPYKQQIAKDTIFIGHSLGPAFILSLLEQDIPPLKGCIFVSGFIGLLNNEQFDTINESFTTKSFNWHAIKQHCPRFIHLHSNNDPYVPLSKAYELQEKTGGDLHIIKNAGHFNADAGYTTFPRLLEIIQSMRQTNG
jgi:hypothetical protein